jgi:hypothetical protein
MATGQKRCAKCRRLFTPAPGGAPSRPRKCCYVCRPLAHQANPYAGQQALPTAPPEPADDSPGRYELRAMRVLEQKGATDTMAGEIALGLARSMDRTTLKPTEVVSLGASLLKTLDQAVAAAPHVPDAQDARARRALEIAESA